MSNPSNPPSIADLTALMQQIAKSGAGKDTKLVASDCQTFLTAIKNCQTALQGLRAQTAGLADYGNVGNNLPDAEDVRSQLITKTNDEALPAFDNIDAWLSDLWNGVNNAVSRFKAEDQGA